MKQQKLITVLVVISVLLLVLAGVVYYHTRKSPISKRYTPAECLSHADSVHHDECKLTYPSGSNI